MRIMALKILAVLAVLFSMCNVEVGYAKDRPLWGFCGPEFKQLRNTYECVWNEARHTWTETYTGHDNWESADAAISAVEAGKVRKLHEPTQVPVEKIYRLKPGRLFREPEHLQMAMAFAGAQLRKDRRFVGINVEEQQWPEESRIWPHLGLTYVGTVAKKEGHEVILWDELIQGPAPLEELIRPGDIVGLSLVTTGIERGVEVARRAKELGAGSVIAGNDSAMFRARQLLELPGKPIDAVFTSNSIRSLREFFRDPDAVLDGSVKVPHAATTAEQVPYVSNEATGVAHEKKAFTADDFFLVPDLGLFGPDYWDLVWSAYRSQFGHKHADPANARPAIALLAQGCGRAGQGNICDYCTIRHVANVVLPPEGYLEETLATYREFGINTFFNVTDSAFEMGVLADRMRKLDPVDTLVMYGRAQAIAQRPDLLRKWLACVNERLLINCGMDSGDETILQTGIHKSNSRAGSRLEENRRAILNIRDAGPKAHLHYSVIFGSPGETKESSERTLDFVRWTIGVLGNQLDVVEADQFWVNFGAPCSEIFHSYAAAEQRAALAGKTITRDEWYEAFAQHADALSVPSSSEEAWYRFFTNISIDQAWDYNRQVREMMETVPGRIMGRKFAFKPRTI